MDNLDNDVLDEMTPEAREIFNKINDVASKLNQLTSEYSPALLMTGYARYIATFYTVVPEFDLQYFLQLFQLSVMAEVALAQAKLDNLQNSGTTQRYPN